MRCVYSAAGEAETDPGDGHPRVSMTVGQGWPQWIVSQICATLSPLRCELQPWYWRKLGIFVQSRSQPLSKFLRAQPPSRWDRKWYVPPNSPVHVENDGHPKLGASLCSEKPRWKPTGTTKVRSCPSFHPPRIVHLRATALNPQLQEKGRPLCSWPPCSWRPWALELKIPMFFGSLKLLFNCDGSMAF